MEIKSDVGFPLPAYLFCQVAGKEGRSRLLKINNNIGFHEGEIVGLAAGLQLKVEKSKGCNVDEDGETLKLSFL